MNSIGFTTMDIFIGVFVLLFCVVGFVKGAIRQFFSILALSAASAAGVLVPYFVKLPEIEGLSPIWKNIIFSIIVWIPSFLILNSVGKFIAKKMARKGPTFSDRIWGAMFGVLKGSIILVVSIFLIDIFPSKLSDSIPSSKVITIIRPFNPLLKLQMLQNLQIMIHAIEDPDYLELLNKDSKFRELKTQESVNLVLDDPDLRKIIDKQEYIKFATHPKVQDLIKDHEALKLLLETDVDQTVIKNI